MKTLKDHVLLYDNACPMCRVYTKGFIQAGMLDENGREPYQTADGELKKLVDPKRAVNEIALVNRKTGSAQYGVKSLMHVLSYSMPALRLLFSCTPFLWLADKAYKFVSYNRRVIIPARTGTEKNEDRPSLHRGYRLLYLLSTWICTAFILNVYSGHLQPLLPRGTFYREFVICGMQFIWQGLFVMLLHRNRIWEYLGNLMTISLAGGLLLAACMGIFECLAVESAAVYACCFMVVAGLMFLEHARRSKLLQFSYLLTLSWALYRIVLLFIVL